MVKVGTAIVFDVSCSKSKVVVAPAQASSVTVYAIFLQSGGKMPTLHSALWKFYEDLMVICIFSATTWPEQATSR